MPNTVIKTSGKIESVVDETIKISDEDDSAVFSSIASGLIRISDGLAPWWSRARDAQLRNMWRDGSYLSSLMFNASSKLTNIPIRVEAVNPNIVSHVAQAAAFTYQLSAASEFGAGLHLAMLKFNEDWLGQDNGGFLEVIGEGPKDGPIQGPVLAVRHIDAAQCTRTGDPTFPVMVSSLGKLYRLHRTRVVFSSQLSAPEANMHDVGYCAVSRSIAIAQDLTTMQNYKAEKMGSRPQNRLLVGDNITGQEIMTAIAAGDSIMTDLGLQHYAKVVAIGGQDVSIDSVDLNQFDPFNEATQVLYGMVALSLAWGMEVSEIFPVGAVSSKASEMVAVQRSRGKLPETYRRSVEGQMSYKLLPPHLRLIMEFRDDAADRERAITQDIEARLSERHLRSGATTVSVERQQMRRNNTITRDELWRMNLDDFLLEDGTPVAQLFYSEKYAELLPLPRGYLIVEDNQENRDEVLADIRANKQLAYIALNGSTAQRKMAMEALSALNWLAFLYEEEEDETVEEPLPVMLEDGGVKPEGKL